LKGSIVVESPYNGTTGRGGQHQENIFRSVEAAIPENRHQSRAPEAREPEEMINRQSPLKVVKAKRSLHIARRKELKHDQRKKTGGKDGKLRKESL